MKIRMAALVLIVTLMTPMAIAQSGGSTQALPGKYIHVIAMICKDWNAKDKYGKLKQVELGFNYIKWDGNGKTLRISGLEPFIKTSLGEKFKILSDLNDVPIKDGTFVLKIEGRGEISFAIEFDNALNIPKDQQKKLFD
jgi:hypothetical protein